MFLGIFYQFIVDTMADSNADKSSIYITKIQYDFIWLPERQSLWK